MTETELREIESNTISKLKDFQRKTVERIDYLFRNGQKRVLVADEVGLGKTLIARGAIVKTARARMQVNDKLFRVAYICSNGGIAGQNIQKLKVSDTAHIESMNDTRLSMLHLKLAQQKHDEKLRDDFIQLIPLTPGTSFRMTNTGGTVSERALMFAILKRALDEKYTESLESFLVYNGKKSWDDWAKSWYEEKVIECENQSNGVYPKSIIEEIKSYKHNGNLMLDILKEHITNKTYKDVYILNALRTMFAQLSAQELEPDLVIMDEFQRFKFILNENENDENELNIIAKKFLGGSETRTLLLSATPYKLYSTLDEIDNENLDEHCAEFMQVMEFLLKDKKNFKEVWRNYSVSLQELHLGKASVIQIKNEAEEAMYQGVCRTERISVMDSGDYIDDSSKNEFLKVTELDINSYLEMCDLLKNIGEQHTIHIDYVKSCPYVLSFMRHYKVKKNIQKYFSKNPDKIHLAKSDLLWVKPSDINKYKKLKATNARLECLKRIAFENEAEMYLWIPPSKPYYKLQGVYKNSNHFSKTLVFSAWEMVPRMIGFMISYEAERRLVEKMRKQAKYANKKNLCYNAKKRYPYPRLVFAIKGKEPQRMSQFTLLYPSKALAGMYDPIKAMNDGLEIDKIEKQIKESIKNELEKLKDLQCSSYEDSKWYYLAPMLMDGKEYSLSWLDKLEESVKKAGKDEEQANDEKGKKQILAHIKKLREQINAQNIELGKMPSDLVSTLTNMALGSFAVCIYRSNGGIADYATSLARVFVNYFNTTEATAIVELSASKKKSADDNTHWQDVLLYCKNGCFQAVIDEYYHLIREGLGFLADDESKSEIIQQTMVNDLYLHASTCTVGTYESFKNGADGEKKRTHYAVGFFNDSEEKKQIDRKNSIRGAFNSPLRPFVLASTSIGQEGLDFHNYCRRVMHWNLPSNPIDLEQREGRVNRFKCLAIRQNVAQKYGSIAFEKDVWQEMFKEAEKEKGSGQSDLVPYWCFGEKQEIKIERIVPMYPFSKDACSYDRLIKILSLYRLTLGQARQEELLEYVFEQCENPMELKKFFINLSPFSKEQSDK